MYIWWYKSYWSYLKCFFRGWFDWAYYIEHTSYWILNLEGFKRHQTYCSSKCHPMNSHWVTNAHVAFTSDRFDFTHSYCEWYQGTNLRWLDLCHLYLRLCSLCCVFLALRAFVCTNRLICDMHISCNLIWKLKSFCQGYKCNCQRKHGF